MLQDTKEILRLIERLEKDKENAINERKKLFNGENYDKEMYEAFDKNERNRFSALIDLCKNIEGQLDGINKLIDRPQTYNNFITKRLEIILDK